ncbi:alcohol dehydrogenase catalytic domain-containing protein, partial [Streptomyces sp. NPDC058171]
MKVVVAYPDGSLRVEERDIPHCGPRDVLVRLVSAACNRADMHTRDGRFAPLPRVLGIDGAGTIEAVGDGVEDVRVGDHVVINPAISCTECAFCLAGEEGL